MSTPRKRKNPKWKDNQEAAKLTPLQVSQLRRRLYDHVDEQVEEAHGVVMGRKQWSPTQARVFSSMLNKVVPDLSANFTQHEHMISDAPEKLSRAQLEAIASTMDNIIDADLVTEDEV